MEITDNKSNYGQQNKTLKTMVVIQNLFSNRTIFNMKQQPAIPEQMTIMFFLENQKLLNELLNYFLMNQKHTERPLLSDSCTNDFYDPVLFTESNNTLHFVYLVCKT